MKYISENIQKGETNAGFLSVKGHSWILGRFKSVKENIPGLCRI